MILDLLVVVFGAAGVVFATGAVVYSWRTRRLVREIRCGLAEYARLVAPRIEAPEQGRFVREPILDERGRWNESFEGPR